MFAHRKQALSRAPSPAGLRGTAAAYSSGAWDVRRFRPNILLMLGGEGWLEDRLGRTPITHRFCAVGPAPTMYALHDGNPSAAWPGTRREHLQNALSIAWWRSWDVGSDYARRSCFRGRLRPDGWRDLEPWSRDVMRWRLAHEARISSVQSLRQGERHNHIAGGHRDVLASIDHITHR